MVFVNCKGYYYFTIFTILLVIEIVIDVSI